MASPVPKRIVDICYDAGIEGYDLCIRRQVGSEVLYMELGVLSRLRMLEYVFDILAQEANDDELFVRVYATKYPTEDAKPQVLTKMLVQGIVRGLAKAQDFQLGKLTTFLGQQLRRSVSPLVPVREIPGTRNLLDGAIECVFCGRGAVYDRCLTCDRTMHRIQDPFRGPCISLFDAMQDYPEVDRFFVNQPWNPDPPWISRQDLANLLNKES